jgi:hypothetical protein
VRFTDFLKATVLISAAAATALAAVTVAGASADNESRLVFVSAAWWFVAAIIGAVVGRRTVASPAIERLLSGARAQHSLPELRPGRMLVNRLWPLFLSTLVAGALAFLFPQVPGIACGFAIIWALAWRRQEAAVTAIEDRDGVQFYIEPASPVEPMQLIRTPGMHAEFPDHASA